MSSLATVTNFSTTKTSASRHAMQYVYNFQINSIEHHCDLSGKHPATVPIMFEDYSYTNIHYYIARYTFTQLNYLKGRRANMFA